jgi:hypothetical protein
MPFMVLRTRVLCVGDSTPVALCASAIAFNRLWMLPAFKRAAHSAM